MPQPGKAVFRVPPGDLAAFGSGAAWVISRPSWLHRIDAVTGERTTFKHVHAVRVAAGDGQVWIVDTKARLVRIDPHTGRLLRRTPVAAGWITAMAVGAGAVWFTDASTGTVWRLRTGSRGRSTSVAAPTRWPSGRERRGSGTA